VGARGAGHSFVREKVQNLIYFQPVTMPFICSVCSVPQSWPAVFIFYIPSGDPTTAFGA